MTEFQKKYYDLAKTISTKPGLKDKEDEIFSLIDKAKDNDTKETILDILINIDYISCCSFQDSIKIIGTHIENYWGILPKNTFFVSSNSKSGTDSSQEILNMIKSYEWKDKNWNRNQFFTRYKEVSCKFKYNKNYTVIIVDDFIGSSSSISSTIDWFDEFKYILSLCNSTLDIKLVAVSVCDDGKNILQKRMKNDFFFVNEVKKIISHLYHGSDYLYRLGLINEFCKKFGINEDLSLGYGKCEASYYRYGGNTPNNVFGMFWDKKMRPSIMHRT